MTELKNNKRLTYIDALRGITMLMVVFYHVEVFSFDVRSSIINSLFITFRMPLFFFISGFIAFKNVKWDKMYFAEMVKKKFIVQILPTLFFSIIYYCICQSESFLTFFEKGPRLYWFTITLFYMFLIYYFIMYIMKCRSSKTKDFILCGISILGLLIYTGIWLNYLNFERYSFLFIGDLTYYMEFFVFGLLCKRYYLKFEQIVSSDIVKAILTILFMISFILNLNETFIDNIIIHKFNSSFLLRYLGLLLVFSLFYHYRNTFDSENRIVRGLRFIGRRTLDIYLLHYFFLPDLKSFASSYSFIFTPQNTVIELVVVLSFSIVIVLMCLGVSAIIRSSSLLGHYLFGAKR